MVKPVIAICFFQRETSRLKNKKVYNLIFLLGKKQTARKQNNLCTEPAVACVTFGYKSKLL
jgi:hypothetical protein